MKASNKMAFLIKIYYPKSVLISMVIRISSFSFIDWGKGWYTYDVHENCSILNTFSLCPSMSKIVPTLELGRKLPLLQMITNQLKENIIQVLPLYVIRSFLQVGFRLQYQPITNSLTDISSSLYISRKNDKVVKIMIWW